MDDEFDVRKDLKKGTFASDTNDEIVKTINPDDKSIESSWKPIYSYILIGIILIAFLWFGFNKFSEQREFSKLEQTDENLDIKTENYYLYKNFEFTYDPNFNLYTTKVFNPSKGQEIYVRLHYGPRELLDVPINHGVNNFLKYSLAYKPSQEAIPNNQFIGGTYILYNPENDDANQARTYDELRRNLELAMEIYVNPAVTSVLVDRPEFPIKDCSKTKEPIIELKYEGKTDISYPSVNCIVVSGEGDELLRAVDRLLLNFYGIMS